VACFVLSGLALGLAPLLMPESYSWVSNTTSESAAQALEGAWLARLGFLIFGLAVLWLSALAAESWGRVGSAFHRTFGILMLATAVFSHRPLALNASFDHTEDLLHSTATTVMGFAFAFGVLAVMVVSHRRSTRKRVLDSIAIAASVVIPLGMVVWGDYAGMLQRLMFLVAYIWYGGEALFRPTVSIFSSVEGQSLR